MHERPQAHEQRRQRDRKPKYSDDRHTQQIIERLQRIADTPHAASPSLTRLAKPPYPIL